nr:PD-(D/E)XK nuclease family protein [uncultured Oscillibacter sp.]
MNGCEEKLRDEMRQLEADANFIELSEKCHTLNLFEILGTTTAEIRHSNFLAWLLDPKGNHGLQDRFLRAFAAKLGQEDAVPKDLSSCVVLREWQHIDLLVICETGKYLLCIENKVFSHEHGNQLQRYRVLLTKEYRGYSMSFAFLTPDGISPEKENDQKDWQPVSYTDVLDAIRSARENLALSPEVNMLLDHYTEAVMKHITGDKNIENLCKEIYTKHKDVLDIIFENCKTSRIVTCGIIEDWCKRKCENNELIYDPQFSNNTYTRFTTQTIRKLLPPLAEPVSGWKSNDIAFYEVVKRENYFKITLTVCSDNMTVQQRDACAKISKNLNHPDKKQDWRWKRIQNWNRHMISPDLQEEEYRLEVEKCLNADWSTIQKFEASLINNLR